MPVMTKWKLTDAAESQMEALGVDALEIFAVLNKPSMRKRNRYSGEDYCGYGLIVVVLGWLVTDVFLEGANADTWEECARRRAELRTSLNMPALPVEKVERDTHSKDSVPLFYGNKRFERPQPAPSTVKQMNVLERVHPALRDAVRAQLNGDYSRLVVHSSTRIEILPEN